MANDFRNYLKTADKYALAYTGNDGRIDMGKKGYDTKNMSYMATNENKQKVQQYISGLYDKWVSSNQKKEQASTNSYIQGLNSQLAALQAQLAYQPKLPSFDVMGNFKRARSQAEQAVNPLYSKYLKDFLAKQATQKSNKKGETKLRKESTAMELAQALAESGVTRTRTAEDTTAAIGKLNEQEGIFQQDSGTQFDIDRRANAEQIAASGLTTSGIGQNRMFEQAENRNIDEGRQVKEFTNQREAKKLFQARTFEDLARGDNNQRAISKQKDKEAQFDLDAYLKELAHDETQFRTENELKRLSDINQQAQTFERKGSQQFLASLSGAGWRPQDIALAYQVYG